MTAGSSYLNLPARTIEQAQADMAASIQARKPSCPHLRRSTVCPVCSEGKSLGTVACWECWNRVDAGDVTAYETELLIQEAEEQLALEARIEEEIEETYR